MQHGPPAPHGRAIAAPLLATCLTLCLSAAVRADPPEEHIFRHEHILGTSMELRVRAASRDEAERVERSVLDEIDRLTAILSRHDDSSELMRWQRRAAEAPGGLEVSKELREVLERAEHWRKSTAGAFDVRAGAVALLWRESDAGVAPVTAKTREEAVAKLSGAPYTWSEDGAVSPRDASVPIDLDGLAKGYILDAVSGEVVRRFPALRDLSIEIGGDVRKIGERPQLVSIVNPADDAEGSAPLMTLSAERSIAVATSGDYRRGEEVAGERRSHIVDPRSGLPVEGVASATVVGPRAIDADALATALSVLGHEDGIALVDDLEDTECLLVLSSGEVVTSDGWPGEGVTVNSRLPNPSASTSPAGLLVEFTIARPERRRGRYRRPYLAVWLEDSDGFPVKTAVLWIQTEQPGPRWHRNLTRWYRHDRDRRLVDDTDLIGTASSATRGPGEYTARFRGEDDAGEALPHGKYTLFIEVAREHGTYQIIRRELELGAAPIARSELEGNVEIDSAAFEYLPWTGSEAGDR